MSARPGLGVSDAERERWALAAAAAGLVGATSYVLQRFGQALGPDPGLILGEAHVAYFWRILLAILHGAMVASAVRLLVDPSRAAAALRWVPTATAGLVPVLVVIAGWAQ